jgi:hypothetical protein
MTDINQNPLVNSEGKFPEKQKCRNCRFLVRSTKLYKCLNDNKKRMFYPQWDACKLFQDKF